MYNLINYTYTCKSCNHSWSDAKEKDFAHLPTKFPCPSCTTKSEIVFTETEVVVSQGSSPSVIDPTNLTGIVKKPEGFKDVLRKVADKYPMNEIKID